MQSKHHEKFLLTDGIIATITLFIDESLGLSPWVGVNKMAPQYRCTGEGSFFTCDLLHQWCYNGQARVQSGQPKEKK